MFFRFLATTLGLAFSLTLVVGALALGENVTRSTWADDGAATPATDSGNIEILDKQGQASNARNTLIPETGTKYKVGGSTFTFDIRNPKLRDIPFLLLWIIEFCVGLGGALAVFYLIYGGFQYFYELRHPSGAPSSGKGTIYHAILGLVIVMISYIFIATIVGGITGY